MRFDVVGEGNERERCGFGLQGSCELNWTELWNGSERKDGFGGIWQPSSYCLATTLPYFTLFLISLLA